MSSSTLAEWRTVETVLREQGHRPFSSWQLLGAGAVGSQSLLGIARLERLRARLGSRVLVWPFTTGLAMPALDDGAVVVAEVWPALTPEATSTHPVRDARQVIDTARWLAALASSGELEDLMSPSVSDAVSGVVEAEEGWVLGVTG